MQLMNPLLFNFMSFLSRIGSPTAIVIAVGLLWLYSPTRRYFGLWLAINATISEGLNRLLKNLFALAQPELQLVLASGYAFPSGHAMNNMAFYALIAMILFHRKRDWKGTICIVCLLSLPPLLIGISRVYLRVQHMGDVVAGWLLGLLVAVMVDVCRQFFAIIRNPGAKLSK